MDERVYMICPHDAEEAVHGKACILTDTMIAQLLDVLKDACPHTPEGEEALYTLWHKLLELWEAEVSYSIPASFPLIEVLSE